MAEGMILINAARGSPLQRLETAPIAGAGHAVALIGFAGRPAAELQAYAERHLPELKQPRLTMLDGQPALLGVTAAAPAELLGTLAAQGERLSPKAAEREKWYRKDLMQLRGWLGNIGQGLMIASTFWGPSSSYKPQAGLLHHLLHDKQASGSILSGIGNSINSAFGTQRKEDPVRLRIMKQRVNDLLHMELPDGQSGSAPVVRPHLPDPAASLLPPDPVSRGIGGFTRANATRLSEVVKLASRFRLTRSTEIKAREGVKASAFLSIVAKFITVAGKDEDPFGLEPPGGWLTRLRRHSNFISGMVELMGNFALMYGAFRIRDESKQTEKKLSLLGWSHSFKRHNLFLIDHTHMKWREKANWWEFGAALAFAAALLSKALAPFTVKHVDTEELHAHCGAALERLPEARRQQAAADIAAQLVASRDLPEAARQGLAATYAGIVSAKPSTPAVKAKHEAPPMPPSMARSPYPGHRKHADSAASTAAERILAAERPASFVASATRDPGEASLSPA